MTATQPIPTEPTGDRTGNPGRPLKTGLVGLTLAGLALAVALLATTSPSSARTAGQPRSAIQPHSAGYSTRIFVYDDGGERLRFELSELQIVSGTSDVCHLPSGAWEAAEPGGSPWSCIELDAGYYDLSNIVDDAIEVRIEALTPNNEIDNIAVDVLT